jgi:hypothetical protein
VEFHAASDVRFHADSDDIQEDRDRGLFRAVSSKRPHELSNATDEDIIFGVVLLTREREDFDAKKCPFELLVTDGDLIKVDLGRNRHKEYDVEVKKVMMHGTMSFENFQPTALILKNGEHCFLEKKQSYLLYHGKDGHVQIGKTISQSYLPGSWEVKTMQALWTLEGGDIFTSYLHPHRKCFDGLTCPQNGEECKVEPWQPRPIAVKLGDDDLLLKLSISSWCCYRFARARESAHDYGLEFNEKDSLDNLCTDGYDEEKRANGKYIQYGIFKITEGKQKGCTIMAIRGTESWQSVREDMGIAKCALGKLLCIHTW